MRYSTFARLTLLAVALVFSIASAGAPKKTAGVPRKAIKVLPKPAQSNVYLDDAQIGQGVTTVELADARRSYQLKVCGPAGYFCRVMEVNFDTQPSIEVTAPKDHSFFETVSGNDVVNKWIQVEVGANYTPEKAWQKLTSILSRGVTDFEVLDQKSFYMKSAWKVAGRPNDEQRTRSRFVVSADSVDKGNIVFRIRIESERINRNKERVAVHDRTFREFLEALEAAQNRLKR
jgi:hypothetical protein